jgi:hypothetical protein
MNPREVVPLDSSLVAWTVYRGMNPRGVVPLDSYRVASAVRRGMNPRAVVPLDSHRVISAVCRGMNPRAVVPLDPRPAAWADYGASMPKDSQSTKYYAATRVIAGLEKRWRQGDRLRVSGKALTRDELVTLYRSHIDAIHAVRTARAALAAAVGQERAIAKRVQVQTPKLRLAVTNEFGFGPDVLADFGWTAPKKPGPKTAEAKRRGAEKLRATRKARQTMGKAQRRKVRG